MNHGDELFLAARQRAQPFQISDQIKITAISHEVPAPISPAELPLTKFC